jgi:hypothetical protein
LTFERRRLIEAVFVSIFRETAEMGKRGPQPKGEYGRKTARSAVLSVRIQPDTRARLAAATQASGRSLSQELEHRLRRTFTEDDNIVEFYGTEQTAAVVKLIGLTLNAAAGRTSARGPHEWLKEQRLFDDVIDAIVHTLLWFRPSIERRRIKSGPTTDQIERRKIKSSPTSDRIERRKIESSPTTDRIERRPITSSSTTDQVDQLIDEIRSADPSLPITKGSKRQHAMAMLKDKLGDLIPEQAKRPRK